jgi:hypothetical protein
MVHLAKRFQKRNYLEIGQSETRIACGALGQINRSFTGSIYGRLSIKIAHFSRFVS